MYIYIYIYIYIHTQSAGQSLKILNHACVLPTYGAQ